MDLLSTTGFLLTESEAYPTPDGLEVSSYGQLGQCAAPPLLYFSIARSVLYTGSASSPGSGEMDAICQRPWKYHCRPWYHSVAHASARPDDSQATTASAQPQSHS